MVVCGCSKIHTHSTAPTQLTDQRWFFLYPILPCILVLLSDERSEQVRFPVTQQRAPLQSPPRLYSALKAQASDRPAVPTGTDTSASVGPFLSVALSLSPFLFSFLSLALAPVPFSLYSPLSQVSVPGPIASLVPTLPSPTRDCRMIRVLDSVLDNRHAGWILTCAMHQPI